MSNNIIKNPARSAPTVQKRYEPEHIRLNKEVFVVPSSNSPRFEEGGIRGTDVAVDESFDLDGSPTDGHYIDNNDFVNYPPPDDRSNFDPLNLPEPVKEASGYKYPEVGEYILMIFGDVILSGTLQQVEEKVKNIVYGEDADFSDREVLMEKIVVLKRVPIKVGIFIEG